MTRRIINRLQNKKLFWSIPAYFERHVTFQWHRNIYSAKYQFREERISSYILRHSLLSIFKMGMLAAVFVVAVEILSHLAKDIEYKLGSDELGQLLSTLVSATGVFLGLYFTALSAVAGNLFLRAPSELQNLFLRDRKGNQYIRTLVLTTIIGIYYLLLRSFGYNVGFLGPVLITVLAIYAVVRFMSLGSQTFYFIHPAEASSTLANDAKNAIKDAAFGRYGSKKNFLQDHHRKQAQKSIKTLGGLIDFGIDPIKLSSQQLLSIASQTGAIVLFYIQEKKHIPQKSLWFRRVHEHQKWLLTSDSTVSMALNTGTSLQPKEVIDHLWLERQALHVILKVFTHLSKNKEWSYAQSCLEIIVSIIESSGSNFYEDLISMSIEMTEESIDTVLNKPGELSEEDKRGHLALIDSLGRLPIGGLVSLNRYLDKRSKEALINEVNSVKWSDPQSVYYSSLPGSLIQGHEQFNMRVKNELIIEGRTISPQWYLRTIVTQNYLSSLKKYYELIKSYNSGFYERRVKQMFEHENPLQAAHLNDRWMEYTNKLLSLGHRVQQFIQECEDLKMVQDLPWTSIDAESERQTVQKYNQQATDQMAKLIKPLSLVPPADLKDLPDYFGQSFMFGLHAAYDAALQNDTTRLQEIFTGVFIGALLASDKVREDVQGWNQQSQIILTTEPMEDIMTLSGFIRIYSELYDNPELWAACKQAWDRYLDVSDSSKQAIETIIAGVIYRESIMGMIMPRDTIRLNWDSKLTSVLKEKGFDVGLFSSRYSNPFGDDEEPAHASALIRTIVKHSLMSYEARTIFYVSYLNLRPEISDITLEYPDRRDFEEQLRREEASVPTTEEAQEITTEAEAEDETNEE